MVLAGCVLLLASFVGINVYLAYAISAGWVTKPPPFWSEIYRPLGFYLDAEGPGSDAILDAYEWAYRSGQRDSK